MAATVKSSLRPIDAEFDTRGSRHNDSMLCLRYIGPTGHMDCSQVCGVPHSDYPLSTLDPAAIALTGVLQIGVPHHVLLVQPTI